LNCVVILWKNNYAALKIIHVGIFLFYFIKISFPVHFLFKWRHNLSARPRRYETADSAYKVNMMIQFLGFLYKLYARPLLQRVICLTINIM
jgi:hypothetical protein